MDDSQKTTSQKLLEVAGEVFAEEGFRATTVREICRRANTNVAAINYHFGDKEKLYEGVFRYIHSFDCVQDSVDEAATIENPTEALKIFISEMLRKMLCSGNFSWKGKLMAREMVDPSPALDLIIDLWFRPCWNQLKVISSKLIEKDFNSIENEIAASSVLAQCFFYKHAREVLIRISPDFKYDDAQITMLSKHLSAFALGGLEALKKL